MPEHFDPSDANRLAREYLDSLLLEERLIDAVLPDLTFSLWGETFASPIMMPAFSHLKSFAEGRSTGMIEYAEAAKNQRLVNWVGMMDNDVYGPIAEVGARTVRIIKPYADRGKVFSQIAFAEEHGAFAVGMDTDHVFGYDGRYDVVQGEPMTCQATSDIKEYVAATGLPFVIKGVLSVSDAVKCAECGVKGIVVSHHHGRLPFGIPPLMVLPSIVKALAGSGVKIFVDCSIVSGADVFKALALGADAVSLGRGMMPSLTEGGTAGLEEYIKKVTEELATLMGYTGCRDLSAPEPSILWRNGQRLG